MLHGTMNCHNLAENRTVNDNDSNKQVVTTFSCVLKTDTAN